MLRIGVRLRYVDEFWIDSRRQILDKNHQTSSNIHAGNCIVYGYVWFIVNMVCPWLLEHVRTTQAHHRQSLSPAARQLQGKSQGGSCCFMSCDHEVHDLVAVTRFSRKPDWHDPFKVRTVQIQSQILTLGD